MEQDNLNPVVIVAITWIVTIALSIGSGMLAWNWIEPESFLGAIGFLIIWAILSKVEHLIIFGVILAMFGRS